MGEAGIGVPDALNIIPREASFDVSTFWSAITSAHKGPSRLLDETGSSHLQGLLDSWRRPYQFITCHVGVMDLLVFRP
jgi:hypothetical protein